MRLSPDALMQYAVRAALSVGGRTAIEPHPHTGMMPLQSMSRAARRKITAHNSMPRSSAPAIGEGSSAVMRRQRAQQRIEQNKASREAHRAKVEATQRSRPATMERDLASRSRIDPRKSRRTARVTDRLARRGGGTGPFATC